MDDPTQIPFSTLERYVAGDCSPDDRARVARWIAEDPARAATLAEIRRIGHGWRGQRPTFDAEAAWARVGVSVEGADRAARTQPVQAVQLRPVRAGFPRSVGMQPVRGIGGAIAAILAVALAWSAGHRARTSQPFRDFTTAAGNRSAVTLRDGTQLVLGPASRLRVPADFGRTTRLIELEGEAYFAVVHDAAHPFAVHTARMTVRDVGTRFDVRAYPDDRDERVAVSEGEVGVDWGRGRRGTSPQGSTASTLIAGDVAVVSDTAVRLVHGSNVAAMTAWTQGRFVFDETPLSEIVRELTRAFDLQIAVTDTALLSSTITASFANETDDQILTVVTQAIGAHFDRLGHRVVIRRGAGAAGNQPPPAQHGAQAGQVLSEHDLLPHP